MLLHLKPVGLVYFQHTLSRNVSRGKAVISERKIAAQAQSQTTTENPNILMLQRLYPAGIVVCPNDTFSSVSAIV